jgi:hypothetical protein
MQVGYECLKLMKEGQIRQRLNHKVSPMSYEKDAQTFLFTVRPSPPQKNKSPICTKT